MDSTKYTVCALYQFASLENYTEMRQPIIKLMNKLNIKGTLLLAHEGINGTVAGKQQAIDTLLNHLMSDPRLSNLSYKFSYDDQQPFYRAKVKLKKEIVTLGVDGVNPNKLAGTYVKPQEWNDLISDPEVILIDTRNDYEIEIGTFKNAINPNTTTFREFPAYAESNLDKTKHKKVAMFCTGGIRCEKSTAFLKAQGFEEVYHLEGGILKYLEEVPKENSLWEGECFVFDNRVAVNHDMQKGQYDQCHACRMPITEEDMRSPYYQKGISCHHCYHTTTDEQKARFAERHKQQQLAQDRGEEHIGEDAKKHALKRKMEKQTAREQARLKNQEKQNN